MLIVHWTLCLLKLPITISLLAFVENSEMYLDISHEFWTQVTCKVAHMHKMIEYVSKIRNRHANKQ